MNKAGNLTEEHISVCVSKQVLAQGVHVEEWITKEPGPDGVGRSGRVSRLSTQGRLSWNPKTERVEARWKDPSKERGQSTQSPLEEGSWHLLETEGRSASLESRESGEMGSSEAGVGDKSPSGRPVGHGSYLVSAQEQQDITGHLLLVGGTGCEQELDPPDTQYCAHQLMCPNRLYVHHLRGTKVWMRVALTLSCPFLSSWTLNISSTVQGTKYHTLAV